MVLINDQKKDYIDSGGLNCPYCDSSNTEFVEGDYPAPNIRHELIECLECDKKWTDVFTLTGIKEVESS